MNIPESVFKIKNLIIRDAAVPLLVVLVGFGSFGLGRMSALETSRQPVAITQAAAGLPVLEEGGKVVASKSGSKYHFPWCSGASKISEKNKVWFESTDAARAAGYTPARNCKGLE